MPSTDCSIKRRQSEYIGLKPGSNLHHAIRLAESKGYPLNIFVTINFSMTDCSAENTDIIFQSIRNSYGKWATRPTKHFRSLRVPPVFVWVIENENGHLHAHWLIHIPVARQCDFCLRLNEWLERLTGPIKDSRTIDIRDAPSPMGLERYLLKGQQPSLARCFNIEPEYQGWVTGRRIGHSQCLGPVEAERMRDAGLHPRAQRWRQNRYTASTTLKSRFIFSGFEETSRSQADS